MRRFTSLLLVLTMLFSMAPGLSFAATSPVAATAALAAASTTMVANADELSAAVASETITDITLSQSIDTTAQLTISRPLTINGAGFTLKVSTDLGKVNGSKHAIMLDGTVAGTIVINDLVVDSNSFAYGVSTYSAAVVELNKVTIKNSKGAGLTVNGSNVTATDFATSGNAWGAVNVDPGSGVLTPSVFTLLGDPALGETNKIWSDRAYVTDTATVSVVAAAYKPTKVGSIDVWVLPRTVDVADTAALILAIRDLKPYDKLVLAEGTYDVKRDLGDLTFGGQTGWYLPISQPGVTIIGAGFGKTVLTSSVFAANGSWASQDFVSVWANDVTIEDLTIEAKTETNKAIEVMGKNFTLKNIDVMTNPIGPDGPNTDFYNFSGSVYFNPRRLSPVSPVTSAPLALRMSGLRALGCRRPRPT